MPILRFAGKAPYRRRPVNSALGFRMRRTALIAAVLAVNTAQSASHVLPRDIADVRWNVSSTVFGNFACQGQRDMAILGVSERTGYVVMVQRARKGTKPTYLTFATRGRDPGNLRLAIEDLDFESNEDIKRELEATAPGLRPSKTCKGLSLGDGESDSHHIYWDRQRKTFMSWSL